MFIIDNINVISKILINGKDFTENLKNLKISLSIDNRNADFTLVINNTEKNIKEIKTGHKVEIYSKDKKTEEEDKIFVGVVFDVTFDNIINRKKIIVDINCVSLQELTKNRNTQEWVNVDKWSCGDIVRMMVTAHLHEDGITLGEVQDGAKLSSFLQSDMIETSSVKDILDKMADASSFIWYVNSKGELNFHKQDYVPNSRKIELGELKECKILKDSFKIETNLTDYANKIFVIGGYPEEDVPEKNILPITGKLKYWKQNDLEIEKMANRSGFLGVWGKILEDKNIVTLKDAENKANNYLEKYGKDIYIVELCSYIKIANLGDVLNFSVENIIPKQDFRVDKVEIETQKDYLLYKYRCTNTNFMQVSDSWRDFKKFFKKKDTTVTITESPQTPEGIPLDGLNFWADFQDAGKIETDSYNGIMVVRDKKTGNTILSQPDMESRPKYKNLYSYRSAEFSPDLSLRDGWIPPNQKGHYLDIVKKQPIANTFICYMNTIDRTAVPDASTIFGGKFTGIADSIVHGNSWFNDYHYLYINNIKSDIKTRKIINRIIVVGVVIDYTKGDIDNYTLEHIKENTLIDNFGKSSEVVTYVDGEERFFNRFFKGHLLEVIKYDWGRKMTQEEISAINNYFIEKYNIYNQ